MRSPWRSCVPAGTAKTELILLTAELDCDDGDGAGRPACCELPWLSLLCTKQKEPTKRRKKDGRTHPPFLGVTPARPPLRYLPTNLLFPTHLPTYPHFKALPSYWLRPTCLSVRLPAHIPPYLQCPVPGSVCNGSFQIWTKETSKAFRLVGTLCGHFSF